MGQGAVPVEALDREVHAGLGGVGPPGRHQLGHQVEHLGDEGGGVGHVVGPLDGEPVELGPVDGLVTGGHLRLGAPLGPGLVDDLVVDVGDVADVGYVEAPPLQRPPDGIERQ
jgi:hypothetical protein